MQKGIMGTTAALGVLAAVAMTIACGDEVTTCESAEDCDAASTGTGSETCPPEAPVNGVSCPSDLSCTYDDTDTCGGAIHTDATCKGGSWEVISQTGGQCNCTIHQTESECTVHSGCEWSRTECINK